jgi:long-subunit acyl-CoA synthetase (AMP-forming)
MSPELELFKQTLRSHAEDQAKATALWGDRLKLDYATLYTEVMERQQRLRDEQIEVVALALDNGVEAMLWDLAALFAGLACVALPGFFSPAQRKHCLEQSRAERVIAEPHLHDVLQAAGYQTDGDFWCRRFSGPSVMPEGTAKLTFTSGTTGTPKGVCLSADSILRVSRELDQASKPTHPQHHLALLPLAILLENIGCYAALYAGATLSLPGAKTLGIEGASGVNVPQLLGCLANRAPQSLILVPQLLLMLVSAAEQHAFDPRHLRFAAVGGARVSEDLLRRAQRVGVPVYEGYGLSECASVVCLNRPQAHRPGSVGQPLPHVEIRLADDGEVLIKGCTLVAQRRSRRVRRRGFSLPQGPQETSVRHQFRAQRESGVGGGRIDPARADRPGLRAWRGDGAQPCAALAPSPRLQRRATGYRRQPGQSGVTRLRPGPSLDPSRSTLHGRQRFAHRQWPAPAGRHRRALPGATQ